MRLIARRLVFYLVTLLMAVSLDFLIPRLVPGDPVQAAVASKGGRSHRRPRPRSNGSSGSTPTRASGTSTSLLELTCCTEPRPVLGQYPASVRPSSMAHCSGPSRWSASQP